MDERTINTEDNAKRTPLCLAAWNGDPDVVDYLISMKASIHHSDRWKQTPLILAARNGKVDAFKRILEALLKSSSPEDIFHQDNFDKSALLWARDKDNTWNQRIIDAFNDVVTKAEANMTEDFSQRYKEYLWRIPYWLYLPPPSSDFRAQVNLLDE